MASMGTGAGAGAPTRLAKRMAQYAAAAEEGELRSSARKGVGLCRATSTAADSMMRGNLGSSTSRKSAGIVATAKIKRQKPNGLADSRK